MASSRELSEPYKRAFIDRARIDCEQLFEFRCPRYFGELQSTEEVGVRYCGECRKHVYLVTSAEELYDRASQQQCVAVILPEELPASTDQVEVLPPREPVTGPMIGRLYEPARLPPR